MGKALQWSRVLVNELRPRVGVNSALDGPLSTFGAPEVGIPGTGNLPDMSTPLVLVIA